MLASVPFPPLPPASLVGGRGYWRDTGWTATSLLDGWFPVTVEILAVVALIVSIGWRTRRWRLVWLPLAIVVGIVSAFLTHYVVYSQGWATGPDHAPITLWISAGCIGAALVVVVAGWASARWWRRGLSVFSVVLTVLSAGIAVNIWVGYFPEIKTLVQTVEAAPLPEQTALSALPAMRGHEPAQGRVVPIMTPDTASGMWHRTEYVYLPPIWFTGATPPKLPVAVMIDGAFATPGDWVRVGHILPEVDAYAAQHGRWAPVLVFVDTNGTFTNDTECVNGPRDNAAAHVVQDVPPYIDKTFGTSDAGWAIAGFSMGGTCAVDLSVLHPALFGTFVDIAGDIGPNAGNKQQTIQRLYGGDARQWAAFDPRTVMAAHGPYSGVAGLFYAFAPTGPTGMWTGDQMPDAVTPDPAPQSEKGGGVAVHIGAAQALYASARKADIASALYVSRGNHTWQAAAGAFVTAIPWLFDRLGAP